MEPEYCKYANTWCSNFDFVAEVFCEIKVANFTFYNTLKLRFARFAEDVKLTEQECLQCWNVQIKWTGVHEILHVVCASVLSAGLLI